ncbi:MAG: transglutaminase family protein [Sphingomonadales bacterium]
MLLQVRAELSYVFKPATQVLAYIEAARSPDQTVLSETLDLGGVEPMRDRDGPAGERLVRAVLEGESTIAYEATVDNGDRLPLPQHAREHGWSELPLECLPFLLPSRFCPSDKFMRFAQREFAGLQTGGAKVHAVLDWIHHHVDYVPGVSTAETTAERTFVDRAGVCRDFTHLGIALVRGLSIPARAVSAYAWQLDPPDFHAIFEVYLDGRWWLVDPTRLAPVEGIVRIATGRDAADIAFLTTSLSCECHGVSVSVEESANGPGASFMEKSASRS